MKEIENLVNRLDIKEEFKSLLSTGISAEIFNIIRLYKPEITISKNTQLNDDRVFCEVVLVFDERDISLFQCRPFIDKSVIMSASNSSIRMRKTYFLYRIQD